MNRILVLGSGGAGKSTLALHLGKALDIKVFHLDQHYWKPNWTEPTREEWLATVDRLISADRWILDGNFSGTITHRLPHCDTIVFLDLPRYVCLYRVFKRRWLNRNISRPDMAEGCPEKLDLDFLFWIWNYSKRTKPKVMRRIEDSGKSRNVVLLQSRADVDRFLHNVNAQQKKTSYR